MRPWKRFVYSSLNAYGVLDKSIIVSCNVISFLELNFSHPIWSFNGKYILDDNWGNNNNNKSLIAINASSSWNSKISISATHHHYALPQSKYIINNRKYSFGWISTLQINRLLLTDEGVYQCTFTNDLGTSSFRINLQLQDKQTVNDGAQIMSICLLSLLILPLLLSILFYFRKRSLRFGWSKQQFKKCGLKINWKSCSESQSPNHTRKSVDSSVDGYSMGVDFTEFVQNQLADEMNNNDNNNNNSSNVSALQPDQIFSVRLRIYWKFNSQ
ncbi:unnamed protein product [Trichobilharzia szidati]|nr:unnamed protein product [Trichobilharzia szidati]